MQTNFGPKQIIISFLIVLACYLGIFHWIEHRRLAKGPWETRFNLDANRTPVLTIHQKALQIEAFQIRFPGETTPLSNSWPVDIRFDQPGLSAAFGEVIYEDLTFLPGVITFNLFGHEIELLPRSLIINKKEIPWRSNSVIDLDPATKPEIPPHPPKGGTRDSKR